MVDIPSSHVDNGGVWLCVDSGWVIRTKYHIVVRSLGTSYVDADIVNIDSVLGHVIKPWQAKRPFYSEGRLLDPKHVASIRVLRSEETFSKLKKAHPNSRWLALLFPESFLSDVAAEIPTIELLELLDQFEEQRLGDILRNGIQTVTTGLRNRPTKTPHGGERMDTSDSNKRNQSSHPAQPKPSPSQNITNFNINTGANSQFAWGHNASQSMTVSEADVGELKTFLNDLENRVGQLGLNAGRQEDLEAQLDALRLQVKGKQPRPAIIQAVMGEIKTILQSVPTSAVATFLLKKMAEFPPHLL